MVMLKLKKIVKNKKVSDKQKKINYLISTIRDSEVYENKPIEEYLSLISDIMCQFDTDITIEVLDGLEPYFGENATYQSHAIKVNYGY